MPTCSLSFLNTFEISKFRSKKVIDLCPQPNMMANGHKTCLKTSPKYPIFTKYLLI